MIIAIDFDGTCVTHDYPNVGQNIGAVPVLKELVANGHQLMLWTMRGNKPEGRTLDDAINWFNQNGIPLWGVNENPEQKETGWTNSNKQYAQLYIDDAALGAPLIDCRNDGDKHHALVKQLPISERPYINWATVRMMLAGMGLIETTLVKQYSLNPRQG